VSEGKQLPVIQPGANQVKPPIFQRVGIVGLGLIGGSIALAARELWPSGLVIGVDRKDVLERAMVLHAIDVAADDPIVLAEADLVILAAPIQQNLEILRDLAENVLGEAIVTDTGSTKRATIAAALRAPTMTFIGGHPMAGAARGGLAQARSDLFDGRPWILTPPASHVPGTLERLEQFVLGLGAVPHIMTPDLHDRFVGAVSHLPQLTASALMHVVGRLAGDSGLELAGAGLYDTTRLATSPPDIWRDVAATNADVLREGLDALIATLADLRDSLDSGQAIDDVFTSACRWREALDRERGT
jgi:prephenate dehydrogenase